MDNIKVIFLSGLDIWSIKDGVGAPSFYNTLKLYIDKGNEVVLIKPTGKWHSEYRMESLKTVTFNNNFFDYLSSLRYISFFGRIFSQWYRTYKFFTIASKEIRIANNQYQKCIIYSYEVNGVKAAKRLSDKYHLPFITRFQGTVLYNKKNTLFNRIRWYPHFNAISQKSDLVIMTDDGTFGAKVLDDLRNRTERKVFWRNGVGFHIDEDTDLKNNRQLLRDKWGIAQDSFVFMTLSRLANWKRIDRAINAFRVVVEDHPDCRLVIVGEGDMRKRLEKLAADYFIEDKVVFAGGVKQNETWKCYNAADAFLSLYDLGNLGNPLYEALYWGKPIITLNNGDTASVIKDGYNALMLPADKENLIPIAMARLVDNQVLCEYLSRNAKEYASKNLWTWENRMEEEYKVVNETVNSYYNKMRGGL